MDVPYRNVVAKGCMDTTVNPRNYPANKGRGAAATTFIATGEPGIAVWCRARKEEASGVADASLADQTPLCEAFTTSYRTYYTINIAEVCITLHEKLSARRQTHIIPGMT